MVATWSDEDYSSLYVEDKNKATFSFSTHEDEVK